MKSAIVVIVIVALIVGIGSASYYIIRMAPYAITHTAIGGTNTLITTTTVSTPTNYKGTTASIVTVLSRTKGTKNASAVEVVRPVRFSSARDILSRLSHVKLIIKTVNESKESVVVINFEKREGSIIDGEETMKVTLTVTTLENNKSQTINVWFNRNYDRVLRIELPGGTTFEGLQASQVGNVILGKLDYIFLPILWTHNMNYEIAEKRVNAAMNGWVIEYSKPIKVGMSNTIYKGYEFLLRNINDEESAAKEVIVDIINYEDNLWFVNYIRISEKDGTVIEAKLSELGT